MYVETPEEAKRFAASLKRRARTLAGVEVWVAPPATLLAALAGIFKKSVVKVGGQSVSVAQSGAHTGGVSAAMLKAAGASFCIVGHSEQRALGVSDDDVHTQLESVLQQGMVGVVCVGEEERQEDGSHFARIAEELQSACRGMQAFAGKLVVAYEPLWAIGKPSGSAMSPQELEETVIFIKKTLTDLLGRTAALKIPILYGGSVEPDNAFALLTQGGVQGLLVGRASANPDSLVEIAKQCRK